ncbi:hypothetical protein EB118_00425 [bacterium]|nr:hypothetical protein [bacterium]
MVVMTRPVGNLSINPASGYWGANFSQESFSIPESFSSAKDGFEQQTFLGASIRNFGISAGYGDSTSSLSVELINDEFNKSDNTRYGDPIGDDVYHDGQFDRFSPPPVGSPVFFKFGQKKANINEAYKSMYDSLYGTNEAIGSIGQFHLCFGGILQSYVQNRGPGGNPLYSVQVVDPREILSNVTLILNNYAGTTFNNANMYNLYGFLEYNPTQDLKTQLDEAYAIKDIFRKIINPDGSYRFLGYDLYAINPNIPLDREQFNITTTVDWTSLPVKFPMTGTGFSRRGPQGMPFYRIKQSFSALLGLNGALPQEYIDAGFGGFVNFRGHNYIVDLSGLKNVPNYYFFDFDQINLLDFCLEVCDITSSELFVSLLPIIPHAACARFQSWNNSYGSDPKKLISGIIRVDSIDKSFKPQYGAIKNYIDKLRLSGTPVENQDVGFELSNVTTDKFIVGAQEVDMYYFSNNNDRDNLTVREVSAGYGSVDNAKQWRLKTALEQQILPYYGLLGNRAVTIPKGWGAYQQILLDSSLLNAKGVGNYYVATEIELRAALISYERWCEFLLSYNDIYMESVELGDDVEGSLISQQPSRFDNDIVELSKNYAVTVPRSVFDSEDIRYGTDGLPLSACNPPYGYPLYYKRATRIGVQGAGLSNLYSRYNGIITSLAEINGAANSEQLKTILGNVWDDLTSSSVGDITQFERDLINRINILKQNIDLVTKADVIGLIQEFEAGLESSFKIMNRLTKDTKENSLKVYNFIRAIAEECLGKKFLVKIPKYVNVFYNPTGITVDNNTLKYTSGPFGFKPRATKSIPPNYEFSSEFLDQVKEARDSIETHMFTSYETVTQFKGALNLNYNPITEQYEYNYLPEKQGGYTNFDLLTNISQNKPVGVLYGLIPQDLTNFLLENSRTCSYVRFDNSQYLSFNGIDSNSFTQQVVIGNNFIPDLTNQLNNVGEDSTTFTSFQENDTNPPPPKSIAFVKCDIDDKFYMPPRVSISGIGGENNDGYNGLYNVTVHGTNVVDIGRASRPRKLFTCDIPPSGGWILSRRYFISHYVPTSTASENVAQDKFFEREIVNNKCIIKTKNENLDTNNVYALITLPGRIVATKDARYRDSIFQTINTAVIKHALTMDVVKIPEFSAPNFIGAPPDVAIGEDVGAIAQATAAYNQALEKSINFSLHNRIQFAAPSPIYPDLVVLPLMSKERCYGPWISSLLDSQASVYQNIGGKIEFIKDENLSPWNYQGYDLMNQAGITQAQFANSLLLQSERGGFVVPAAPSGVSIGRALANLGPLITNISVDISDNGIRTTFKMDLYTSSFGKLQKQKQDAIANISRERQKLKDERNTLIRKGLSKNQTNVNYNLIYNYIRNQSIYGNYYTNYQTNSPSMTQLVVSVDPNNNTFVNEQNSTMFGSTSNSQYNTLYSSSASVQSNDQLSDTINNLPNTIGTSNKYYNSAGISLSEMFVAFSKEPHPNMPYLVDNNLNSSQSLYDQISSKEI